MSVSTHESGVSTPLAVRRWNVDRDCSVPARHWCNDDSAVTHLLNSYTMLVPENERFFIRTLNEIRPKIQDPELAQRVHEFVRQEAQHGVGHRRAWDALEKQGYRIRRFIGITRKLVFEPVQRFLPLSLRISLVSCVEHINAYIAHEYLTQKVMDGADPEMRALFEWHFAEEIEHKAVAFDVLQTLRGRYALRVAGVLLTVPLFYLLAFWGAFLLMVQDGSWRKRRTWGAFWRHVGPGRGMFFRSIRHIGRYLSPSFSPWDLDDAKLSSDAIERSSFVLVANTANN